MGDMVWGPPHQTRPFGWKGPHTARRPQVDGLFFCACSLAQAKKKRAVWTARLKP